MTRLHRARPSTGIGILSALIAVLALGCNGDDAPGRGAQTVPANVTATVTMVARDGSTPGRSPGPGSPATFEVAFPQLPRFERPVALLEIPGQGRMLLAQQDGRIVSFAKDPGASDVDVALDWRDRTSRGGNEEGMLGMALDPGFGSNGFIYLYYNVRPGERRTQLSRFATTGTGADFRIDGGSELPILTIPQPYANHNGGQLAFGPDGMLYLGLGDGGSAGDPHGYGQDISANLLGSILRIDVRNASPGAPYTIPSDNPFAGRPGVKQETWAYGLRNPWRFSFDRETGTLIAADVGQNRWEEIDIIERGGNYGWSVMEGPDCFRPAQGCDTTGLVKPIAWYGRSDGCSVTGGYVYRGEAVAQLYGAYLYADFCTGKVWSIPNVTGGGREVRVLRDGGPQVASFGEDLDGELYLLSFDGRIYRVAP